MSTPRQPDQPGPLERNAGWLVLFAFLAPVPLKVWGTDAATVIFGGTAFLALLMLGLTGYLRRSNRRREEQVERTEE